MADDLAPVGFGIWTQGWLCDAPAGPLSPVFGIDYGCSDDMVICWVSKATSEPQDPLDRLVDGLRVRECLERYEQMQRGDGSPPWLTWKGTPVGPLTPLTPAQLDAARLAWSAQLRAKQDEARGKERVEVVVDDDRWEP